MLESITTIPAPRVSIIDDRTGLMSREWYRFFLNLFVLTGSGQNSISLQDVQLYPPTIDADPNNLQDATFLQMLSQDNSTLEMLKQLQGLESAPIIQEHVTNARYGSFYDTTDQNAAVINTAYAMTFNTTSESFGVYVGSPSSRIYVDSPALYNIQFSAQLVNTAGGSHAVWIWLRKNGTDVPDSSTKIRIQGNSTETVAAWNFFLRMNSGDYFELMWEVSDIAVSLFSDPATAVHPVTPSIILTVHNNIT